MGNDGNQRCCAKRSEEPRPSAGGKTPQSLDCLVLALPDTRPGVAHNERWFVPLGAHIIRDSVRATGRSVEFVDLNIWFHKEGRTLLPSPEIKTLASCLATYPFGEGPLQTFRSALLTQIPYARVALCSRSFGSFNLSDSNVSLAIAICRWLKHAGFGRVLLGGARCKREFANTLMSAEATLDVVFYHEPWSRPNETDLPAVLDWLDDARLERPDAHAFFRGSANDAPSDLHVGPLAARGGAGLYDVRFTQEDLKHYTYFPADLLPTAVRLSPRWQMWHSGRPQPGVISVKLSDGCPNRCAFCDTAELSAHAVPPAVFARYLADTHRQTGARSYFLLNRQLNISSDYLESFCRALIAERVPVQWSDSINLDQLKPEAAPLLREAGCTRVSAGVETVSARLRRLVHRSPDVKKVVDNLEALHEQGIWITVNLIVGLPTEGWQEVVEAQRFLRDNAELYQHVLLSRYKLYGHSPLAHNPARYGIAVRSDGVTPRHDDSHFSALSLTFDEVGGRDWDSREAHSERAFRLLDSRLDPFWQAVSGNWPLVSTAYEIFHAKREVTEFLLDVSRQLKASAAGDPNASS